LYPRHDNVNQPIQPKIEMKLSVSNFLCGDTHTNKRRRD
jgi:hypothetical protein